MQVSSWCLLLICFVIFTSPSRVLASLTLTLDKCQYRPRLSARPTLLASRVSASLRYWGSEIINMLEMTVLLMSGMLGSGLWCVVTDKWTSMLQFYPKALHNVALIHPFTHSDGSKCLARWRQERPFLSTLWWADGRLHLLCRESAGCQKLFVCCIEFFSCIFSHFGHVFSRCCTVIKSLADGNVLTVVLHKDLRCCSFLTDWILAITGKS